MSQETRLLTVTYTVLVAGLSVVALLVAPAGAQAPARPATTPVKSAGAPAQMAPGTEPTKEEFRKLPPTALLTVGGKQMTKQAFIEQTRNALKANRTAVPNRLPELLVANASAARAKFAADQRAKLEASNTKVFTEAARLAKLREAMIASPGYQAIEAESQSLLTQYKNASPAEKTRIEVRARELHKHLQQIQAVR